MSRARSFLACLVLVPWGCGGAPQVSTCPEGQERSGERCIDPVERHQPAARLDRDNVVAFGDPLTQLKLPEPPRSGFRIVVPPRRMMPGEEKLYCVSWPFPELRHRVIYAARLYTTSGLHHSNVFTKPVDPIKGKNPYPDCHPGAADPFKDLPRIIPDVLFGNSTQIEGEETLVFPKGHGYPVDTSREIITNIHLLNVTSEERVVEAAYDFFTMAPEQMSAEVAPFHLSINKFLIRPGETRTISTACDLFGGSVVSMMLHTHSLALSTEVERWREGAFVDRIYKEGAYDIGTDIKVYDPPLVFEPFDQLRMSCTFHNTTGRDVVYGLGENEMCVAFGYITPPAMQLVGYTDTDDMRCKSINIGAFRKP